MIAIIALLTWNAVTTNCRGIPEPVPPVYEVWTYRATVSGYEPGPDGSLQPLYNRVQLRELVSGTTYPMTDPEVGNVLAWAVEAVDLAGNRSDQPCN